MFVIASGSMALLHAGRLVDVLEPGECFGHPSLLSGRAPSFTVVAHENSSALLIPREEALRVFGHPAGAAFVASSLRERMVRTGQTVQGLPDLSLARLGSLVHREPLMLGPEVSIREAAVAMTEERTSAALVEVDGKIAMVTDAELGRQGLAEGRSPDDPVSSIAQTDPLRVPGDRTVGEALVDLLDEVHGRDLCVVDADGRVIGTLGIENLAGGEHRPLPSARPWRRRPTPTRWSAPRPRDCRR